MTFERGITVGSGDRATRAAKRDSISRKNSETRGSSPPPFKLRASVGKVDALTKAAHLAPKVFASPLCSKSRMTAGRVEPMRQILNQSLFTRLMTVEFKNKITETYFVEPSAHYLRAMPEFG